MLGMLASNNGTWRNPLFDLEWREEDECVYLIGRTPVPPNKVGSGETPGSPFRDPPDPPNPDMCLTRFWQTWETSSQTLVPGTQECVRKRVRGNFPKTRVVLPRSLDRGPGQTPGFPLSRDIQEWGDLGYPPRSP